MELTQLKYFCEVASSLHVTESAKKLNIAQPALTQTLKRLENELGVSLFKKNGRNIELTRYGKYLYSRVRESVDILRSVPEEIRELSERENFTVHLNIPAASIMTTLAVVAYRKLNRNVQFKVYRKDNEGLCDIDVSTRQIGIYGDRGDLSRVFREKMLLAVPKSGKYGVRKSISLQEIGNENFICLTESNPYRVICDKIFEQVGISPNIIFESDSPALVRNLISSNTGIGLWPEFSWGRFSVEDMTLLPVDEPYCGREIVITCNSISEERRQAYLFYEYLTEFFRCKFSDGEC